MNSQTYLNDTWSFYFHDPQNEDWRTTSYIKVADISTAEDYWSISSVLNENISKGMFFLMRENVFPCWDDEANLNGGCLSIKVLKNELQGFWDCLAKCLLTETVLVDNASHMWNKVNGISTSPKKHFCIVKIWVGDKALSDINLFNIDKTYYGEVIYKSNLDNISIENQRRQ